VRKEATILYGNILLLIITDPYSSTRTVAIDVIDIIFVRGKDICERVQLCGEADQTRIYVSA